MGRRGRSNPLSYQEKDDAAKWRAQQQYMQHCNDLRSQGIDPHWIGIQEVKPVYCIGCGTVIPWFVLKGWRD